MRVMSLVGARPQFVKLGPVSRALRGRGVDEYVLHTGQHHDVELSAALFEELALPRPDVNLGLSGGTPARQAGAMIPAIAEALAQASPALVIVFGDTMSTLAGAVASAYAGIPVAHVEAGMRSFNRAMPEELNRVVVDHLSTLLFTASPGADRNLRSEGIGSGLFVGDVMYDVVRRVGVDEGRRTALLGRFGVCAGQFVFATVHRASNTDDPAALGRILEALAHLGLPVVFPLHPRTRKAIAAAGLERVLSGAPVRLAAPLGYRDTIALVASSRRVFTDSGGLQKEAFYLGVPCTTLREETEWVETVELGWNVLVGTSVDAALSSLDLPAPPPPLRHPYGDGTAGERIAEAIDGWDASGRPALSGGSGQRGQVR